MKVKHIATSEGSTYVTDLEDNLFMLLHGVAHPVEVYSTRKDKTLSSEEKANRLAAEAAEADDPNVTIGTRGK